MPEDTNNESPKTCAACGNRFSCEYSEGADSCWCFDLPALDNKELNPGQDCFCLDCLRERLG
ncbi:MAG: hypothetical protein CMO80_19780 [Verrucomicrobiales bacterium]|nr:hypothetical protein [Verrucomicrobiales bacterium]